MISDDSKFNSNKARVVFVGDEAYQEPLSTLVYPYVNKRSGYYIENTNLITRLVSVDGMILPIVVNDGFDSNCYITSAYTNYVIYADEYVDSIKSPVLKFVLKTLVFLLKLIVSKQGLDKSVYVNNWHVATGPNLSLNSEQVSSLSEFLYEHYPKHAIIFKHVDENCMKSLQLTLGEAHQFIFNRKVYVYNRANLKIKRSAQYKKDRGLLKKSRNNIVKHSSLDENTRSRLQTLYNNLYINKYSNYNAQYSGDWFSDILSSGMFEIYTISPNEEIDYFVACYKVGSVLTGSIVGHDQENSRKYGLYRIGISLLMEIAEERGLILNISSGAGWFKQRRGCIAEEEFDLVKFTHLNWYSRLSWKIIAVIYNNLVSKLFNKLTI